MSNSQIILQQGLNGYNGCFDGHIGFYKGDEYTTELLWIDPEPVQDALLRFEN